MNHFAVATVSLASRVAAAAASWGRVRISHGVGTSACATTPAGSGHGLKGVRFSRVGVGDRRRVRRVRCSELLLVAWVVRRVAVARNARVARIAALLRLEGAVASVWPKRGLRRPPWPTAPAARTNRRTVALIISAEVLSLRFLLPESQWPVFQRGLKDRAIKDVRQRLDQVMIQFGNQPV